MKFMTMVEPCIRKFLIFWNQSKANLFLRTKENVDISSAPRKKVQGGRAIENKVYKYQGNPEKF